MPAVVGLIFDGKYEFGQLACLDGVRAIGPDGKIVYAHGRSSGVGTDRIVAVSPPPGTPIGRHDQVTVNVAPEEYNSVPSSGLRPCDWVRTTEASALLGDLPVTTSTLADQKGSTTPQQSSSSRCRTATRPSTASAGLASRQRAY
jgi:beta-lactam-binding protein with PASTA domain